MGTRELSLKTNKKLGGRVGRWGGGVGTLRWTSIPSGGMSETL